MADIAGNTTEDSTGQKLTVAPEAESVDAKREGNSQSIVLTIVNRIENNPWRRFIMWVLAVGMLPISLIGFFIAANNPNRPYMGLAAVAVAIGIVALALLIQTLNLRRQRRMVIEEQQRLKTLQAAVQAAVAQAVGGADENFRRQLKQDPESQWSLAYEIMTTRQTWGYADLDFSCEICDDGAAHFKRTVEVDVRGATSLVEQSLNASAASLEKRPEPKVKLRGPDTGAHASIKSLYVADNGWLTEVQFDPALGHRETAKFILEEYVPSDYYAIGYLPEQLEKEKITEGYFGWRVDRPMKRLSLHVYFPVGFEPKDLGPEVRIQAPFRVPPGDVPRTRHDYPEEERIRVQYVAEVRGRRQEAHLTVSWPIVGRFYLIRWLPLQRPTPEE